LAGKSEGNTENFRDPGADGRKILKLISTKWGVFVWAAMKWLTIGSRVMLDTTETKFHKSSKFPPTSRTVSFLRKACL
jgi:hypothetical protein